MAPFLPKTQRVRPADKFKSSFAGREVGVRSLRASQVCHRVFLEGSGRGSGNPAIGGDLLDPCLLCLCQRKRSCYVSRRDRTALCLIFHSNGNDNDLRHLLLCPNLNVGFLNGELVPSPPLLATASHAQTFTNGIFINRVVFRMSVCIYNKAHRNTLTVAKNNCIHWFSKILTSLKNRQLY